jgi:hypothetical protein
MSASQPTRLHTDAVMEVSSGSKPCGSIAVPRTAGIGAVEPFGRDRLSACYWGPFQTFVRIVQWSATDRLQRAATRRGLLPPARHRGGEDGRFAGVLNLPAPQRNAWSLTVTARRNGSVRALAAQRPRSKPRLRR